MASPIVLLSDFGAWDWGVVAMKGVCKCVREDLAVFDLCHELPPMDRTAAARAVVENAPSWPENAVFVCAVDPGYTPGRPVFLLTTQSGQRIVAPASEEFRRCIEEGLGIAAQEDLTQQAAAYAASAPGGAGAMHGRDLAHCGALAAARP